MKCKVCSGFGHSLVDRGAVRCTGCNGSGSMKCKVCEEPFGLLQTTYKIKGILGKFCEDCVHEST